jgi:hypothetical protein
MDIFYRKIKKLGCQVLEIENKTWAFSTGTYNDCIGEIYPDGRITVFNTIDRDTLAWYLEEEGGNSALCNQDVSLIIEVIEYIDKELEKVAAVAS